MAEEQKQEEKKSSNVLATLFKVVLGLAFLGLGAWAILHWLGALKTLIKGCIGPFLILAGIITLAIAKE